ncbi:peptidogalycan biosysnthesis protein [Paraburkholderia humisilvae]|uniref:BioF2-like acetyltransferase domain-containing protein n=2 Tax=Paraburkholderia humisilvae TaxID=627669 RepID=A0A6J5F7S8_9BURK|nr:peptidogalycan biosysnthesis protein [Paraburkholderia humisilvae]CAB3774554.1 hypothetical protein LMG29542_07931 [Paraburkholderia humisilvae]
MTPHESTSRRIGAPHQMVNAFDTRVSSGISAVGEHDWDALVSDNNFFNSHRWLASIDNALGNSEVLTVWSSSGLAAGCALWDGERVSGLFYLPDYFTDMRGPWQEPFLWLGGRRSTHNEIPCVAGERRTQYLRKLGLAAADIAARRGLAGFVSPYMPVPVALEFAGATGGTLLLHSAEAAAPIPSGGLPEAMAAWKSHDRVQSKAEISAFERKGNRIEWTPINENIEALAARLVAENRARYGSKQGSAWMARLLTGQRQAGVLQSAVAAVASRGDAVTALTIFYRFGEAFHARYFGCDYDLPDNDFRYFVLTYYAPVNYAAAKGLKHFRLSTSALKAKARRGARIEPLAAVVKLTGSASLEPDDVERHNNSFVGTFQREYAGHLSHEWPIVNC